RWLRPAKIIAGSGAPPPEENTTERKYNFLPGMIRDIGRLSPPTRSSTNEIKVRCQIVAFPDT
ncbi:MAG: hypothetical protein WB679_22240, partial [Terracidiphilus sp.]